MEESIYNVITQDSTLGTLLGNGDRTFRVYPLVLPEAFPESAPNAMTYTQINKSLIWPLLRVATFQFNCFGKSLKAAREIADALNELLDDTTACRLAGGAGFPVTYIKFEGEQALKDDLTGFWYLAVSFTFKF